MPNNNNRNERRRAPLRSRRRRQYGGRRRASRRSRQFLRANHPSSVEGLVNQRGRTPRMTVQRNLFEAVPDILFTYCTYYENNFHLDLSSSDTLLYQTFSINDPHDPYTALGGKSANFYPQIMALYRYSRVMYADVIVKYTDVSGGNTCPIQTALVYNSENIIFANWDDVLSLPKSKRVIQLNFNNRIGSTVTLRGRFSPSMAEYMTAQQWNMLPAGSTFDNTNLGSIASPSTLSLLDLYYGRIDDNDTSQIGIRATVTIKFYIKFYHRQIFSEGVLQLPRLPPYSPFHPSLNLSNLSSSFSEDGFTGS